MAKIRKTKKQKVASSKRMDEKAFSIKSEWLTGKKEKKSDDELNSGHKGRSYFRADLTKTFVLTMLVLALELALWQYLSKN